jgi:hypothetical protein
MILSFAAIAVMRRGHLFGYLLNEPISLQLHFQGENFPCSTENFPCYPAQGFLQQVIEIFLFSAGLSTCRGRHVSIFPVNFPVSRQFQAETG